jgi:plasmid replication initiation protein
MEETKKAPFVIPYKVTFARYNFTSLQKNITYKLFKELQSEMTTYQGSLFDKSRKYTIRVDDVIKDHDYRQLIDSAKELMKLPFEYEYKDDNGIKHTVATVLIASADHPHGTNLLTIEVPSATLPVLIYIGGGFTALEMTVAMNLNSKHSKRLYEMCCHWKREGGFNMSLDDFRGKMFLEKSYRDPSLLKKYVLDVAKKELKESADVWFEYSLTKIKSRSFNSINFKIFNNDLKKINAEKGVYTNVYNFLVISFPAMFNDKAMRMADKLAEQQQLAIAWSKFRTYYEKYLTHDMDERHLINLTKKILTEDFQINPD